MKKLHRRDLVVDPKTGRLSASKIWSHIGKAFMTYWITWETLHNGLSEWMIFAYGGLVISHELASRIVQQRQQKVDRDEPNASTK